MPSPFPVTIPVERATRGEPPCQVTVHSPVEASGTCPSARKRRPTCKHAQRILDQLADTWPEVDLEPLEAELEAAAAAKRAAKPQAHSVFGLQPEDAAASAAYQAADARWRSAREAVSLALAIRVARKLRVVREHAA